MAIVRSAGKFPGTPRGDTEVKASDTRKMIETAIALGVAAIPEGLPMVATIAREIRALNKEAPSEVLDAWLQFSPDPPGLNTDPTARLGPDMEIADATPL